MNHEKELLRGLWVVLHLRVWVAFRASNRLNNEGDSRKTQALKTPKPQRPMLKP